jgi:hypothetical protein
MHALQCSGSTDYTIGEFATQEDAGRAYDVWLRKWFPGDVSIYSYILEVYIYMYLLIVVLLHNHH